ncbi:MAG TPA: alpha/beta hydrolase-fold protein [Draconibacterium sp.]|nr:alpha/beta hydrolase-fold protein [Draconibacterium sp.]
MKTKILIGVLAVLFALVSCEKDNFAEKDDLVPTEKSVIIGEGKVVSEVIHSPALEDNLLGLSADRKVNVYLPKSYENCPGKHYPVIYFLHGMPAWSDMLMEAVPFGIFQQMAQLAAGVDFPAEGFLPWLNNLIDDEGMREVIIVMPDASTLFGPSMYVNNSVIGNFEDYIVEDVVAFVDSHYRTIPHFNWRAISGQCAGGYGAMSIAMKHPKVFRYVGALSPAHFPEQTWMVIAQYMLAEDQIWFDNWGVPAGPTLYSPYSPFKFANCSAYMLGQNWLPNLGNPPYFCDLTFVMVDGVPVINPELMTKVDAQNLPALSQQYEKGLRQLKTVYFDCGENDELGMYQPNVMLNEQLNSMHIKHQFETYSNPGTHISNLYERLGKVWVLLSNNFPECDE